MVACVKEKKKRCVASSPYSRDSAHDGSIWKLAWAPPEYGDILASASYDRTVIVWEKGGIKSGPKNLLKWINRARLVDSRQSVADIAFAPKHLGLQLATCSADGNIRVYEAVDVMNLMHWPLIDEFEASREGGATCISWSQSQFGPPSLVVGTAARSMIQLFRYSETRKKWQLSEVTSSMEGAVVGDATLNGVAWAPNFGRTYELIATASQDKTVRIWKLTTVNNVDVLEQLAVFRDHKSEVWNVEWNVTGTILASSGDDGVVRLWTRDPFTFEWRAHMQVTDDEKN